MSQKTVEKTGCRREVWLFFQQEASETGLRKYARVYEVFSVGLVIYLVVMDIMLSIPELAIVRRSPIIARIEFGIYLVFTTEYSLRLWACMADRELSELGPIRGRIKLASGVMNIVDLVVCAAYYINFLPGTEALQGMGALRMIRLFRVATLLKVERKTNSIGNIMKVLTLKRMELISTVFMAGVLMVMSAAIMYYIEVSAQPVAFGSIPASMWWSITALTTVGYGDVVPQTGFGKLAACIIAFVGVGIFALPAGILGEGFMEVLEKPGEAEIDKAKDEIYHALESKELKAKTVKEGIEHLRNRVERVSRNQQRITKLIKGLTPELVAQAVQAQNNIGAELPTPPHVGAVLPIVAGLRTDAAIQGVSLGATGLAAHCASMGERELANLQDRVQQKLSDLSAKKVRAQNSQSHIASATLA